MKGGDDSQQTRDATHTTPSDMRLATTLPTATAADGLDEAGMLPTVHPDRYEITGEIGRGGIGRVTAALDRRFGREVAIKELLHRPAGTRQRFLREALLTARLQHPSIVPVYDAGYWPDGSPFYSMTRVSGRSLKELLDGARTLADRLALVPHLIAVADAVAYAHSKRIVHRDLKPSNVVVGSYGETIVVDWGLAKDLAVPDVEDEPPDGPFRSKPATLTVAGEVVGTPAYMAPEQARGERVDEQSDVYAIGAILYQLLAGEPPYIGSSSRDVVERVATEPPAPLAERARGAPPDLIAIADKAMARARADRYATAKALAEDLRRFETGQLVSAHHYGVGRLLRRWVGRHRGAVAVGAIALAALAVIATVSVRRVIAERDRARREQAGAMAARDREQQRSRELVLAHARAALDRDPTETIAWLSAVDGGPDAWSSARMLAVAARQRGVAATILRGHEDQVWAIALSPDGARLASVGVDGSARIWDLAAARSIPLVGHPVWVVSAAWSPDGARLATADADGGVRVWRAADGTELRALTGPAAGWDRVAFAPDGSALAGAGRDGVVRVWPADGAGAPLELHGHDGAIYGLVYASTGELVTAGADGTVRAWSPATGHGRVVARAGGPVIGLAAAADAPRLAWIAYGGGAAVMDLDGTTLASRSLDAAPLAVALSADGVRAAIGTELGDVHLWAGGRWRAHRAHTAAVTDAAIAADGRAVTVGEDGRARLWTADGLPTATLFGHTGTVRAVAWSARGDRLITSGDDAIRVWPIDGPPHQLAGDAIIRSVAWSPDGSALAIGDARGRVRIWRGAGGERVFETGDPLAHAGWSADGAAAITTHVGGAVRVLRGGELRELGRHDGIAFYAAFAPDGARAVSAGADSRAVIWSLAGAAPVELAGHGGPVLHAAWSPDGALVATAGRDGVVRVFPAAGGAPRELGACGGELRHVAFDPSGAWVATGGADGSVCAIELATGARREHRAHRGAVVQLAFVGDDLVSAGVDAGLVVWPWRTAEPHRREGHRKRIAAFAPSPDSDRIATVGHDGTVRLFDRHTDASEILGRFANGGMAIDYAPDGALAVGAVDGTVHLWRDDLPTAPDELRAWLRAATNAVTAPGGGIAPR